jgi:hypothetical protein
MWRNNITEMAGDLGVSHAALSRVLAGQMPSGKMLEALGKQTRINVHWLLTGEGEALLDRGQGIGGCPCPISDTLLPGEPRAHPDKLCPVTLPVASPYLLGSPYWYRVGADDPIVGNEAYHVTAGDYLLIDTSTFWTGRHEAYRGRIVALTMPDRTVSLGRVSLYEHEFESVAQYEVQVFGVAREFRLFPHLTRESAPSTPPECFMASSDVVRLYGDDVVGVCLQLCRILERALY